MKPKFYTHLGTVRLFDKSRLFFTEELFDSDQLYIKSLHNELLVEDTIEESSVIATPRVTPVDEDGNTDYIEVFYKDAAKANYPYTVTVWVLIEEELEKNVQDE